MFRRVSNITKCIMLGVVGFSIALIVMRTQNTAFFRRISSNVSGKYDEELSETMVEEDGPITFTAPTGTQFTLPNKDKEFILSLEGFRNGGTVRYMRSHEDILKRGEAGSCASMLDSLAWIMDEINAKNHTLIITYDDLLHLHQKHDFKRDDGSYIENDMDLWASFETIPFLAYLEAELFRRVGWSMRMFVAENKYVVFVQIFATCGHVPDYRPHKIVSSEPSMEIYPITFVETDGSGHRDVIIDMWQKARYSASMIYPARTINFKSVRSTQILHLQIPNHDYEVLTCLYGDWRASVGIHASPGISCFCTYCGESSNITETGYISFEDPND